MGIKFDYVLGKLRESDAGGGGGGTDANAVHVNAAGEINGITKRKLLLEIYQLPVMLMLFM